MPLVLPVRVWMHTPASHAAGHKHARLCKRLAMPVLCFGAQYGPYCTTDVHNRCQIEVPVEGSGVDRAVMPSNSCMQQHTCPQIPATNNTIKAACEDKRLTWMAAQCYYSLHMQSRLLKFLYYASLEGQPYYSLHLQYCIFRVFK